MDEEMRHRVIAATAVVGPAVSDSEQQARPEVTMT